MRVTLKNVQHKNSFHLLRLLAASLVIISHSFAFLALPEPIVFGRTLGNFAVDCFFVISGYLVTASYSRDRSVTRYLTNRGLRIIPGAVIAMGVAFIIWTSANQYSGNPIAGIVNGPIWTLPWEVVCYVFTVILGLLGILFHKNSFATLSFVLWIAFLVSLRNQDDFNQVIFPLFMCFLGGAALATFAEKLLRNRVALVSSLVGLLFAFNPQLVAIGLELQTKFFPLSWMPPLDSGNAQKIILLLSLPIVLIRLGQVSFKWTSLSNDYSYGLYLYGWPVGQFIVSTGLELAEMRGPIILGIETLVVCLCFAAASWHLVEKPALKLKSAFKPALSGS